MKFLNLIVIIVIIATGLLSCESDEGGNGTNISAFSSTKSHNMGQNCMDCHRQGGPGYGWFNIAGTVYDTQFTGTYPNATVKLYTGPNGTGDVKYVVEVDGKGNFYTTENIDFGLDLYPAVVGTNETHYMSTAITTGQCNSCHGVSTNRIWTN